MQGSLHYATLTGLAPNTQYFYRYGDSALALFSPEYSFTPPPVPAASASVKWLAWADAGQAVADNTNEYDYYDVSPLCPGCCRRRLLTKRHVKRLELLACLVGSFQGT